MFVYKLISYVLHPLLFSFMGSFLYLYLTPKHIVKQQEYIILLIVFISTYIIPILLLALLKRINLINDYHLRSIDERKFPILFFIMLSFLIGRAMTSIQIADLLAFSFFGRKNITVSADGHTVTLRGTVSSISEKDEAEKAAYLAPGVYDVKNELRVQYYTEYA